MHKVYYVYNPRTACYDRVYPTFRQRAMSFLRRAVAFFLICLLGVLGLLFWVIGPSKGISVSDNHLLHVRYDELNDQLDEALDVMNHIKERDDNLYRVMVQADPVADNHQGDSTYSTTDYTRFDDQSDALLLKNTEKKMQDLRKKIYYQSSSFDLISGMFQNSGDKLQCIPSIQPIKNTDLKNLSSGFGLRYDPIFGNLKMHEGLDFVAAEGTPIFVTGAGVVSYAGWKEGYGFCTIVDHGYGYKTLYGHQNYILVRTGQSVKRGEKIGLVGSTGKSTGPHLHYEVMIHNRKINPVNFFSKELTPQQYDDLLRRAATHANVYD